MNRRDLIAQFDKLSPYTDRMIERGIETHRKGLFAVKVLDAEGKPAAGVPVKVKLARHEFKFGCSLFLLEQFPDEERNRLYREEFKKLFNYGVM
ncbi:MAG: glycoside hydrolase family 10, partial [Clostridia bacterium]|nr:glycoside hydrolase family 10 [Clostridia bacterium]